MNPHLLHWYRARLSDSLFFHVVFFFLFWGIINLYFVNSALFYILCVLLFVLFCGLHISIHNDGSLDVAGQPYEINRESLFRFDIIIFLLQCVFLFKKSWGLISKLTTFSTFKVALFYTILLFIMNLSSLTCFTFVSNLKLHKEEIKQEKRKKAKASRGIK